VSLSRLLTRTFCHTQTVRTRKKKTRCKFAVGGARKNRGSNLLLLAKFVVVGQVCCCWPRFLFVETRKNAQPNLLLSSGQKSASQNTSQPKQDSKKKAFARICCCRGKKTSGHRCILLSSKQEKSASQKASQSKQDSKKSARPNLLLFRQLQMSVPLFLFSSKQVKRSPKMVIGILSNFAPPFPLTSHALFGTRTRSKKSHCRVSNYCA